MEKGRTVLKKLQSKRSSGAGGKASGGKASGGTRSDRGGNLKALVGILTLRDAEKLTELINGSCAALSYEADAKGTARSSVLDYLGLGETEKKIVISLFPERAEEAVLKEIRENMHLYLAGKGICFTVPLTGASAIVANALRKSVPDTEKNGGKKVKTQREYCLIVTAMQKGFAEEAMEAARAAGAAGGSVLTAATLGDKKAEQLIGVTLQKETDVLLILAKNDGKDAITEAILKKVGLKTDGGGVVFTLPVDSIAGVGGVGLHAQEKSAESADTAAEETVE